MKTTVGSIFRAALLGCLMAAGVAQAQITDINSAINKAGRERMLSQRMAKAYFQLGLGVDTDRSKRVLDSSISLFDRQLVELKNFAPTPEIKDTYQKLEGAWIAYKDSLVGAPPNPEGGKKVLALSEQVLALAQQGTVQLEKHSGTTAGRLVNISGRQRMLSQRMAKFYFYRTWGLFDAPADMELHLSRAHFTAVLIQIEGSQHATAPVKAGVTAVRREWEPYQQALFANKEPAKMRRDAARVAELSERVLVVTEDLVARLVAQAQGALTTARA